MPNAICGFEMVDCWRESTDSDCNGLSKALFSGFLYVGRISDSVMRRMVEVNMRCNTATAYCTLRITSYAFIDYIASSLVTAHLHFVLGLVAHFV